MSAEANTHVVLSFLENLSASRFDAALALMADSATVWIAGKPDKSVLAGTITKAQFAERVKGIGGSDAQGAAHHPEGRHGRGRPGSGRS